MDDDTSRRRHLLPALLPPAIVLILGLISIARHPGMFEIVTTAIATGFTLIATIFMLNRMENDVLAPFMKIVDRLDRTSGQPSKSDANRMAATIDHLLDELIHEHRESLGEASDTNRRLRDAISQLESVNRDIETSEQRARQDLREEKLYRSRLVSAVQVRLQSISGFTSVMLADAGEREAQCLTELERATRQLMFLMEELQEADPAEVEKSSCLLAQTVDDAIAGFHPLAMNAGFSIYPLLAGSCPDYLAGAEPVLKALLFNYILHQTFAAEPGQDYLLECHYGESGDLIIVLSPPGETLARPHTRLRTLLSKCDASLEDGLLAVPMDASGDSLNSITAPVQGLRALVTDDDPLQRQSVVARLKRLGMTVTDDREDRRVDLCFAGAMNDLGNSLPDGIPVFLLNSITAICPGQVVPLRRPLSHIELINAIVSSISVKRMPDNFTVLAVDDNEANLRLLVHMLKEIGLRVISATNGVEAVRAVEADDIDLVIMDVQMPVLDGPGATRRIREMSPDHHRLPVIGLSATVSADVSRELREAGMNDVLEKPLTHGQLDRALMKWLDMTSTAGAPVFDRQLSLQRANQRPELAGELFEILITSLQEDRNRINDAWRNGNEEQLARLVHRLHGSVQYCGVSSLARAIAELEEKIRQGAGRDAGNELEKLNREVDRLLAWHRENPAPFAAPFETSSKIPSR